MGAKAMIPDQVLSTEVRYAPFLLPRTSSKSYLDDYSRGGTAIGDSSLGMDVRDWHGFMSGDDIMLEAVGVPAVPVITGVPDITEFQFTFDAAMRPVVCYVAAGMAYYYWFDGSMGMFVTTAFPTDSYNPRCVLDDKRYNQIVISASDVILAYMRAGSLYFRASNDSYITEYLLESGFGPTDELVQIGMNEVSRFQFRIRSP